MSELIIEPGRAEKNYWRDLWRYRELFYFLAWRDILVRYKQTIMGIAWSVVRPLLTMVIFTILFSRIAKLHAPAAVPYALLVMAGMLPWQFISGSMTASSESMVQNSNLVSKIYFPRLIVPASSVITSFVDFAITLVLMAIMMAI
jgi:lipopolysaccharide transport system permease protein